MSRIYFVREHNLRMQTHHSVDEYPNQDNILQIIIIIRISIFYSLNLHFFYIYSG